MTLAFLLAVALNPFAPVAQVADGASVHVHVVQKPYRGWKGAYWISNDMVELVVVPEIGRVMRYALLNKDNLLWENVSLAPSETPRAGAWLNYGGDKLWVAPQSVDTWPPDIKIDPGPYRAEPLHNGIKLVGPSDSNNKVRITRTIVLADRGSKVEFTNMLQNLGSVRQLSPWQVTQVDDPAVVILPCRMTAEQQAGFYDYGDSRWNPDLEEKRGDELWLKRDPHQSRKFGSNGLSGEIKAEKRALMFHMVQDAAPSAEYPDHNSAQQVYLSADPLAYAEMEQVGPLTRMEIHEVAIQHVQWFLSDVP